MSSNKWEDKIRTKLKDRHETVPDSLWQKIEADLPPVKVKRKSLYNIYRNIAAIVAIIILSGTAFLMFDTANENSNIITEINENLTSIQNKTKHTVSAINKTNHPIVIKKGNKERTSKIAPMMAVANIREEAQPKEHKNGDANIYAENKDPKENDINEKKSESIVQKDMKKEVFSNNDNHVSTVTKKHKKRTKTNIKNKWSISIETGNTFRNQGSTNIGFSAQSAKNMLQTNDISTYKTMFMTSAVNTPQTSVKHYFPITGALTLRKYITDRISVESGLQYTMLRTDIKTGSASYCLNKQKLQYLGVPIKVNYDIINRHGLVIYASGGGAMEGCVSAKNYKEYYISSEKTKNEIESIDINRTQWSVNASMGVQYNIIKYIGLYAEPGITYYFDDGNDIESIRKKHPLNFQLKAGVRLNF